MCGIIGVELKDVKTEDLLLIERLFRQTMIRGKHATGISYRKKSKIHTIKENVPVTNFLQRISFNEFIDDDGSICLIGHIRYSTSDLRYPQPFSSSNYSISHNGVISQEEPNKWKYQTKTANDSELILCSLENEKEPLVDLYPSSMAVVMINLKQGLTGFRNESRPLWYTNLSNGIIFTSTKDIAIRSGLKTPSNCEMYVKYSTNKQTKVEKPNDIQDLQSL